MKINLIYNKYIPDYKDSLERVEQVLIRSNIDFHSFELSSMENYGDFAFVIGGDGTLLRAARFYAEYNTPVMGLNLGRLGFLAQADICEFEQVLELVLNNNFSIEDRLMLKSSEFIALNDFVIKGCYPSRTSKFFLEINDNFVCDYIADGLIISTPTGSTAYGLSAGGPVLSPMLDAIVIVPICPHTLNARPLVVPAGETVSVKTAEELLSITVDGYLTQKSVEKITITTAPKRAKLAFVKNDSFYSVLRNKLHWSISPCDVRG